MQQKTCVQARFNIVSVPNCKRKIVQVVTQHSAFNQHEANIANLPTIKRINARRYERKL